MTAASGCRFKANSAYSSTANEIGKYQPAAMTLPARGILSGSTGGMPSLAASRSAWMNSAT